MSGKVDKLPSKPWLASYPQSCAPFSPPPCLAKGSAGGSKSTPPSWPGERNCEGFLLVFLAPILLLLAAFFLGTLKVTLRSQSLMALQSRVDICAVKLAVARERVLDQLTDSNGALQATVLGINAARSVEAVPYVGEAAAATAEALLLVNQSIAAAQEAAIAAAEALEAAGAYCASNKFSDATALCLANPPIASAFSREETLYQDVTGRLRHRDTSRTLAKIRCSGAEQNVFTELGVYGDSSLQRNGFSDAYLE